MKRKLICALDTGDLTEAKETVRRLGPYASAFKIGHALTLQGGLDVVDALRDEGAARIFLDLKFHDIPNTVGRAVREAAKRGVWMMTLHISGGPAMVTAAVEEARYNGPERAPLLVGVSVLTSLDQHVLTEHLGVSREIEEHMVYLSRLGVDCGLDGVVCSVHEIAAIRAAIGHKVIVTPGIRPTHGERHDQQRVGDARTALDAGADYLVIGRALTGATDPVAALRDLGLESEEWQTA
jgi:orotidine-5'-phosphate decarboxylase